VAALLITLFGHLLAAAEMPDVRRIGVFGYMDIEASVPLQVPSSSIRCRDVVFCELRVSSENFVGRLPCPELFEDCLPPPNRREAHCRSLRFIEALGFITKACNGSTLTRSGVSRP
jgi:hypothetical protein